MLHTNGIRQNRIIRQRTTGGGQVHLLKFTLTFLTIAGCWRPLSWTSLYKSSLYNLYTVLLILVQCSLAISQFMFIILEANNIKEITDVLRIMGPVCIGPFKMFSLWNNHKEIANIINTLYDKPFKTTAYYEMRIQQYFNKLSRNTTLYSLVVLAITATVMISVAFSTDFREGNLRYKAWLPFNHSCSSVLLSVAYTYQVVSMAICAWAHVSFDCLICGLLLHICCQIEILVYRLKNTIHTPKALRDCVHHHDNIFTLATMVNNRFAKIIAIQLITSTLGMCSHLYQLAETRSSTEYLPLIMSTFCSLTQIFFYCWFGNEVKLRSLALSYRIFEMDWLASDNDVKKTLLMIMNRARVPIEFTSAYLFTMNLDSFVKLLKLSYSIYTVLHHISHMR